MPCVWQNAEISPLWDALCKSKSDKKDLATSKFYFPLLLTVVVSAKPAHSYALARNKSEGTILGMRNQLDDEDDDTNEQTVNQNQASGDGHQVSGNAGQAAASQKKTSLPSSYQPGGGNRAYSGNPGAPASLAPPGSAAVRNEGKT